jgi:hypothetical protein
MRELVTLLVSGDFTGEMSTRAGSPDSCVSAFVKPVLVVDERISAASCRRTPSEILMRFHLASHGTIVSWKQRRDAARVSPFRRQQAAGISRNAYPYVGIDIDSVRECKRCWILSRHRGRRCPHRTLRAVFRTDNSTSPNSCR